MPDIHLCWFSIDDRQVTATRSEIRAISRRLKLPQAAASRTPKLISFKSACRTQTSYLTDDGVAHTLTGREHKKTKEYISYHVVRDDGVKMAEFKYFVSRRTHSGMVRDSHSVRSLVRAGLEGADRDAARDWIKQATAAYVSLSEGASWMTVRRQARSSLLLGAVPIFNRDTMYFVYDDDIALVHRVQKFLTQTVQLLDFQLVAVDDDSDRSPFALSADAHLAGETEPLLKLMRLQRDSEKSVQGVRLDGWFRQVAQFRTQLERHERRLGHPLSRSTFRVAQLEKLVQALPRRGKLP